ncbi:uncharacterized protein LOC127878587 [Dreissena polymorpha]|uniref:Uncharacterized protein n=1 Tax=Dreissena polymorpha TaxID=45954 RepID=A0A9D4MQY4_DREPO|nr:uncharacterized protein LOC127878587 [Dreissena polymorpha]KAH3880600.1 hypothetical protein DPMN_004519 [Dreissena polymorpha]
MAITTSQHNITDAPHVSTNNFTSVAETSALEESTTTSMNSVMTSTQEPKQDNYMYYVLAGVAGFVVLLLIVVMIAFVVISQRRRRRNVAIMNSKSSQRVALLPSDDSRLNGVHNSLYGPDASSDDDTILPFQLPPSLSSRQPDTERSPSNQTSNVVVPPASILKKSEKQERSTLEIVLEEQNTYANDSGPGYSAAHALGDKVQEGVSSFMIGKKDENVKQPLPVPSANVHSRRSKKNLSSTSFNTENDLDKLKLPPKPTNLKSSKSFSAVHQNTQDHDFENLNDKDYVNCENLKVNLPLSKSVTKLAGCKDTQTISRVSIDDTESASKTVHQNRSSVKKSSSMRKPGQSARSNCEQHHSTSYQGAKPKSNDSSFLIPNFRNPMTPKDLINDRPHTEHTYSNLKNHDKFEKPLKSMYVNEPFASGHKVPNTLASDNTKIFNLPKTKERVSESQTRGNERNSGDYENPDGAMQSNKLSDENYEIPDSFETLIQKFETRGKETNPKTKKLLHKHGKSKTLARNEKLRIDGDYLKMTGKGQLPAEDDDDAYLTPDSMSQNATQDDMYVRMGNNEVDDEYVHMDGSKEKLERENAKKLDYLRMSNDLVTNMPEEQDLATCARQRGASLPFDDMSKVHDFPMASPPPCGFGLTSGYLNYDIKPRYVNCEFESKD